MSFLDFFTDLESKTVQFQVQSNSNTAAGIPGTSWTNSGSAVKVTFWTDSSRETNTNDKFVDKVTGRGGLKVSSGIVPTTNMRMYVSATEIYLVVGVDNVAGQSDFYTISWVRDL